jgi:hypothetical protein
MRSLWNWSVTATRVATVGFGCFALAVFGCGVSTSTMPVSQSGTSQPVLMAGVVGDASTITNAAMALAASAATAPGDWGTIKGQVVAAGPVDPLKLLITKGDASAKDSAVCAAHDVPDESLLVDSKTGGVANVVVYLQKKPTKIHPELVKSKDGEVVFDQKSCRFLPHVLLVRTDQKVRVVSDDAIAHNTHTYPLKNKQENFVVSPNDRTGVVVPSVNIVERLPAKVGCDIHPWMQAYWVILDHPYAAVTKADGSFEIKDVPVGDHVFTVWQEKVGYLDKAYKVTVKAGDNDLKPIKVPVATLSAK